MHSISMYVYAYVCVCFCMCVCMYVSMHFHDVVHITHTHMYARAPTGIHAYSGALWRPCWLGRICMCSHTYACMHAYICIHTHVYRTMWWPSWWGRTHDWEQTALCWCWIVTLLCALHRSSLLTSGELMQMYVCTHIYAAVGSFSRCIYCTLYTCTCLLPASVYVLVCVRLVPCWLRSHISHSRVCV
jgi:hypothetical protein